MNCLRHSGLVAGRALRGGIVLGGLAVAVCGPATLEPAWAGTPSHAPPPQPPQTSVPRAPWEPGAKPDSCRRCYVQGHFWSKLQALQTDGEAAVLRNGVGLFYTTKKARNVERVQELVEEWLDSLEEINESPGEARLCAYCRRDYPWYSQLDHEVLGTSHGSLVLITSEDPRVVQAIHKMYQGRSSAELDQMRKQMEEMKEAIRKEVEKMPVKGNR